GLGVPVFDASVLQQWDEPFRIVNQNGEFIGDLYRQRRFATLSTTWLVPRVRRSIAAQFGAQLELRRFASDSDAVLGPPESITRRGTRYYSLFGGLSASTARAGLRAISAEEGLSFSLSSAYRWRTDV